MTTVTAVPAMTNQEMIDLAKKHTLYEWSAQSKVDPIPVARAKGIYFWTPEGKRFIDFNSQLMSVNIGHGDERVIQAARDAEAHQMFSGLKQGYDTLLGNQFEGGQELSIGQWQRVALARAFMRDAQLVVLDEPTSALDVMTEHEVFERFRHIIAGRAAIIISHRLSTVRMAHRIYVLEGRNLVESGTHDELMQLDGIYAGLFRTQSQHYQ